MNDEKEEKPAQPSKEIKKEPIIHEEKKKEPGAYEKREKAPELGTTDHPKPKPPKLNKKD